MDAGGVLLPDRRRRDSRSADREDSYVLVRGRVVQAPRQHRVHDLRREPLRDCRQHHLSAALPRPERRIHRQQADRPSERILSHTATRSASLHGAQPGARQRLQLLERVVGEQVRQTRASCVARGSSRTRAGLPSTAAQIAGWYRSETTPEEAATSCTSSVTLRQATQGTPSVRAALREESPVAAVVARGQHQPVARGLRNQPRAFEKRAVVEPQRVPHPDCSSAGTPTDTEAVATGAPVAA